MAGSSTDASAGGSVISLPKGGGAISGLGESFSPDLFTGTANFSVPIAVPPGRRAMHPKLQLVYSSGNGSGPFGLGWAISVPGISRKTSRGVPRYVDDADTFLISGAEDLVPVAVTDAGRTRYRPRTEGMFSRVEHVRAGPADYWEVWAPDGLLTRYGTAPPQDPPADWHDPTVLADPAHPDRTFGWRITSTSDPLGNQIRYDYLRDRGENSAHRWDQPLLQRIRYADYGDRDDPSFLVAVEFEYEPRPDPFSDYRAGFEIRTTLRCHTIRVVTQASDGTRRVWREYRLGYRQAPFNGASLLASVQAVGVDADGAGGAREEAFPPVRLDYTEFDPAQRRLTKLSGQGLPAKPLSDPNVALVDLRGTGLPDLVELGAQARHWANRGAASFAVPRPLDQAPSVQLGDAGVRLLDANGNGRADLVVMDGPGSGYFPTTFAGVWARQGFQPYAQIPGVALHDPRVRLVDLDGDGLTDLVYSGAGLTCWFNDPDPQLAWQQTLTSTSAPPVDLADPRVQFADMTGDGLQDLVLVRSGNLSYWPNLGRGAFGAMVTMAHSPHFPDGFDPRRVLLGDVDGDGLADVSYVDQDRVLVWGNQQGNGFAEQPLVVAGTPSVPAADAIQLSDLNGTGMAGFVFSRTAAGVQEARYLELTGGAKPHLLRAIDNHLGAVTRISYRASTAERLRDEAQPGTRWRTPLPVPVHVVSGVEVEDRISATRQTVAYRYHHGYWDGEEREFRGFGMVEHTDTASFAAGEAHEAAPVLSRTWFHLGPVAATDADDWTELDLRHEFFAGDQPMLERPPEMAEFLVGLPRSARRAALRAMRGQVLRTELYGLDGSDREALPYTVTESLPGVREEPAAAAADPDRRVFSSFPLGNRTTQWERGDDPMTKLSFTTGIDRYGMATGSFTIGVPRGRDPRAAAADAEPYLATFTATEYARRDDDGHYLVDRVARETTYEIVNDGRPSAAQLRDAVLDAPGGAVALRLIGHGRKFYDGEAFTGLPLGQLGEHGLLTRSESLAFTDAFLDALYPPGDPAAVSGRPAYLDPAGPDWSAEYPQAFRDGLPALAGYRHEPDGAVPGSPGGYYVAINRHRYDVHDPARPARGLVLQSLDAMGASSTIAYDPHDLLPVESVDAVGLATTASYDYRMLAPRELTDPNGNRTSVTYSPAGFVTEQFVRGKDGEGDLAVPSVTSQVDLLAFAERGQPVSVRSTRRIRHDGDGDAPADERDAVVVTVEYSDGFGRLLQTRSQAEATVFGDPTFGAAVIPADQAEPVGPSAGQALDGADAVVVAGWQRFDNKGRVVEHFEPFFATGWDYRPAADAQLGQKTTYAYDPRGQLVHARRADGGEQRVLFGVPEQLGDPDRCRPTPWEAYTYDANDNAGRTHPEQAGGYRDHWDTPASVEVDALGRTVRAVARNGPDAVDELITRFSYDVAGSLMAVTDALGRPAYRYAFDLANRRWRVDSIDGGRRDAVPNALSEAVETRDAKGALTLTRFDALHRPTHLWARHRGGHPVTLRQRIEYGDEGDRDAARAANLLGRPARTRDEAGLVAVTAMDFKGNLLAFERRVIADRPLLATYEQAAGNGWQVPDFAVDWTPAPGQTQAQRDDELLEPAGYAIDRGYDALGRVTRQLTPADAAGARHELRPRHNRAGALEQVSFDGAVHVDRIAYNARGQRTLIAYGNGVMTRYAYEPATSRLARVRTEPYAADGATYRPAGAVLQDLGYRYDLAGNVVAIADRTPGSGIPDNPQALGAASPRLRALLGSGDALDREFRHDPTYRLVRATGREVDAPTVQPWSGQPRSTDTTRAQAFTETYVYDAVNSLLQLRHNADGGGTRVFTVDPESNRVQTLAAGTTVYDYAYDACGNLLAETTSRHFGWNHADQLVSYATQTAGAEPSVHVHYLYDAAGDRVKKLVRRQGGGYEVTHYLEGGFEHHRWGAAPEQQNNHVHVGEDTARIALVRLGPAHPDDPAPAVQYQLTDQVGSSSALLDAAGALINREEFTPFGETSFGSYARKRYRFTGQERDEETGMTYHRARYCAPWLARWASADPLGIEAGANGYSYCGNSPLEFRDPAGLDRVETVGTENPYGALAMAQVTGLVDVISESRFEEITRWQVKNTDAAAAEWKHAWSFDEARELAEADADSQRAMVQAKWSRFVNDKYDVYYDEQVAKWDDATRRMENAGKAGKLIAKVTLGVIAGAGPLASSYLAIGGVATAKQLGFGLLLAGATSSGDTSGCGGLAAMGGGAMPTKSGPGAALPATRAAGTATEAEALAPLQAETVGGQRVFYAGPEGAGSTVGLRYHEGGLVTADTIFPARFAGVRRYSGIIENHLGLRGPTPKLWLSGVHGTPQGLLTREVRFLHIDREVLGRRTTSGWTVGDVLNPGGVTVEDPAATFLAWCHSTALCR